MNTHRENLFLHPSHIQGDAEGWEDEDGWDNFWLVSYLSKTLAIFELINFPLGHKYN